LFILVRLLAKSKTKADNVLLPATRKLIRYRCTYPIHVFSVTFYWKKFTHDVSSAFLPFLSFIFMHSIVFLYSFKGLSSNRKTQ